MLGNREHIIEFVDVRNDLGLGGVVSNNPIELISRRTANTFKSYPDHDVRMVTCSESLVLTFLREDVIVDCNADMFNTSRKTPRFPQNTVRTTT